MERTGVAFGTSGTRGLVTDMTDALCFAYATAFLQYLESTNRAGATRRVAMAGDRRQSTPRILAAVAHAARTHGYEVVHCGEIPSPALVHYGMKHGIPSMMVTGSHIPEDRNGIKFNRPDGEILKDDEKGIREQEVELPDDFDETGALVVPPPALLTDGEAIEIYRRRYLDVLPPRALEGLRIGVYGHSAVGRTLLVEILRELGANVLELGFSDKFEAVDTEALRPEDAALAEKWAQRHELDAIVSTDGDSDRPLVGDEHGQWMRGDVVGIVVAAQLRADVVVTPVSSNTAVERSKLFRKVVRTRIGSPWVIEAMAREVRRGAQRVVGYEANGGFLTATPLELPGGTLDPLPSRDALIVILTALWAARSTGRPVSELVANLPPRFTASDRLKDFPPDVARNKLEALRSSGSVGIGTLFGADLGMAAEIDAIDGLRITFASGDIVHLRPSGNAPELRCYAEADDPDRARALARRALEVADDWR